MALHSIEKIDAAEGNLTSHCPPRVALSLFSAYRRLSSQEASQGWKLIKTPPNCVHTAGDPVGLSIILISASPLEASIMHGSWDSLVKMLLTSTTCVCSLHFYPSPSHFNCSLCTHHVHSKKAFKRGQHENGSLGKGGNRYGEKEPCQ